ncbi:phosphate/phosphite/phosphonate ABC transporter substrate-binding protein [Ottowia testudinis]|uniref:PhnD/SsuA/transferrin family substrate-binding protein n=1 Tax=Ottowia testudinis TaxID=2816950 RepID=A0A975CER7_9BURK|nr:PhnD/SsuA/transferrin family substrate-binding protein [Ottowia testudinis]QTD44890.1 PhnD/SsuA/transferrin family substrate-binding protein [Ottowia testudinis]
MSLLLRCLPLLLAMAPTPGFSRDLLLGVSEGTSGGTDHARVILKYGGLAKALGGALKADVHVVFVREFAQLEDGMKTGRLDLAMARPSDFPARGLRDYGYQYVATAKPDGQCFIVVPKGSPIKSLDQVKGQKIAMPEKVSYMSKFCAAELRHNGIDADKQAVTYVREQEAVIFYITNGFTQAGAIASYSGAARKWIKDGGQILHKSVTQPYFPMIAKKDFTKAEIAAMQKALSELSQSPDGEAVLKSIGITGFDITNEAKLRQLLNWLGCTDGGCAAAKK